MKRVVHFEISADEPERAAKFYQEVFDWEINKWEGPVDYWLATTGDDEEQGINGAIKLRSEPSQAITNTIEVPSVDDYLKTIVEHGGTIVMPKVEIPGIGFHAYFKDSEGNTFGLLENLPETGEAWS